ncbi:DUF3889 domain-containing protein [Metabacillus fastidiosus]|uniref:DUF3889 domain-containing protein n=1 Tax=Metabacillus fastidiosus TaxID=1458 RepID=UPI002E23F73E|nr:DUF3889 domain-containing protein [Metabacillus fastidiosus]
MKYLSFTKIVVTLFVVVLLFSAGLDVYGQHNNIDYKQWSRIAISTVKKEYPAAQLTDYKYVGRAEVTAEEAKDIFNIVVKEGNESFNVKAEVFFNPKDGKLITVQLERVAS